MGLVSRLEALALGLKRYDPTVPCKKGHSRAEIGRARREANPDYRRAKNQERRRKVKATPICKDDLHHLRYETQDNRCGYCQIGLEYVQVHLDHKTPLSLGGEHALHNVHFTCAGCNLSKGATSHGEFLLRSIRERVMRQCLEEGYGDTT